MAPYGGQLLCSLMKWLHYRVVSVVLELLSRAPLELGVEDGTAVFLPKEWPIVLVGVVQSHSTPLS